MFFCVDSHCFSSFFPPVINQFISFAFCFVYIKYILVGDCGKTGRKNGAMECSNIGVRKGMYNAVKLEKGEKSRAVRSYAGVTREYMQTPLGKNILIIT